MLIRDYISTKLGYCNELYAKSNIWCIGDVHGCGDEFEELLRTIKNTDSNSYIVQLGDLIDRGPHLLKVFDLCDEYDVMTIIGNHEYNFWLEVCSGKPCRSKARQSTHEQFNKLKSKHKDRIIERIATSKNYLSCYSKALKFRVILSHAPVDSNILLNGSNSAAMNWCTTSSNSSNVRHPRNVHGHTHWEYTPISDQIAGTTVENACYNIDSGCVYGGGLTALCLTDLSFIQVKSKPYFKE